MGLKFWLWYVQPCCAQSLSVLSISISPSHCDSSTSAQAFGAVQVLAGVSKPVKIAETPLQLLNEQRILRGLASVELGVSFSSGLVPWVFGWTFGCCAMRVGWCGCEASCTFYSSAEPFPVSTSVVHRSWSLMQAPGCEQQIEALAVLDGQLPLL